MKSTVNKRETEKHVVGEMIALYCPRQHHTEKGCLCHDCAALVKYARERSDKYPNRKIYSATV